MGMLYAFVILLYFWCSVARTLDLVQGTSKNTECSSKNYVGMETSAKVVPNKQLKGDAICRNNLWNMLREEL